jgi:CubicO group peptidase (beta-lactamase class C family)
MNRLQRCTPESQGVSSSAILQFVEAVEQQIQEFHSFMLLRHGVVIAEGWWSPYSPDRPHMLFSLSKSFTSTAIGLAISEGHLSLDDRVVSFFPDEAPKRISQNLDTMQIRHLLAMSTGHADDTTPFMVKGRGWIKAFLARPVKFKPGTHFLYNTGATYMLSAILQRVTGTMLLDYLQPRLFQPLGIQNPDWEVSPEGIHTGGFGLSITTEDIAKFGQLYLQKGQWNGQQLVPAAWIEQATSYQSDNGSDPNNDWQQGYGYQFWRCRHKAYRGDGAFGQYCIVLPDQDAVLAITSAVPDMQALLNLIWQLLLPALKNETPLPDNTATHEQLSHKLGSLALLPPPGRVASLKAASLKTFVMEPNPYKIKTLTFDFSKPEAVITLRNAYGKQKFVCGAGAWREGILGVARHSPRMIASGVWSDDDTFVITLRYYETPFIYTLSCHVAGDHLMVDGSINVSFDPTQFSLVGHPA